MAQSPRAVVSPRFERAARAEARPAYAHGRTLHRALWLHSRPRWSKDGLCLRSSWKPRGRHVRTRWRPLGRGRGPISRALPSCGSTSGLKPQAMRLHQTSFSFIHRLSRGLLILSILRCNHMRRMIHQLQERLRCTCGHCGSIQEVKAHLKVHHRRKDLAARGRSKCLICGLGDVVVHHGWTR